MTRTGVRDGRCDRVRAVDCSEGRTRELQQRSLEGATDGTAGLINELAAKQATDSDGARNLLIESLGGIPIGRPAATSAILSAATVPTIVPETRQNSASGANASQLAGSGKYKK